MTDRIETVINRAAQGYIEFFGFPQNIDVRIFINKKLEELPKLLPKTKMQWVKELRSGKFKQINGVLLDEDRGYCCLGVCGISLGISIDDMDGKSFLSHDAFTKILVDPFSYSKDNTQQAFSQLNDEYKLSFYDIATIIEEYC
jgi:hypothetical protein